MSSKNKKSKNIVLYFYIIIILFALCTSATYTWFSISQTPRVSNMGLSVSGMSGLELAYEWNAEEWTQILDLSEKLKDEIALKPATWVDTKQKLYTASYTTDGRIVDIDKELNDKDNTNRNDAQGYYLYTSVFARTDADVDVSLMPAGSDGANATGTYVIGTPVWNSETVTHNNGGNGAEYTIRIGIRITKYDLNGYEKANSVQFYVYEPNYDGHIDGVNNKIETPSITGKDTIIDEKQLIRQTTTSWTEAYPVERNVVVKTPGEFLTEPHLFELNSNELARIDLLIWMEGQDVDCGYHIGTEAKILANIQFNSEARDQSGLEEFR